MTGCSGEFFYKLGIKTEREKSFFSSKSPTNRPALKMALLVHKPLSYFSNAKFSFAPNASPTSAIVVLLMWANIQK